MQNHAQVTIPISGAKSFDAMVEDGSVETNGVTMYVIPVGYLI